jgi:hypothetical protein
VNISLENTDHEKLLELKELLKQSNLHETVAKIINIAIETFSTEKNDRNERN